MAGGKKKSTRWLVDLIVDGGGGIPWGQITYADAVGIEMNANRLVNRRVYQQALACALANSMESVPRPVIAATCQSKEEADRLEFDINAARNRAAKGW